MDQWEAEHELAIAVSPIGGIWQPLQIELHGMCGEYIYAYTIVVYKQKKLRYGN